MSMAVTSTLDRMISEASFSPKVTIPLSIDLSSSSLSLVTAISMASDRSLMEMLWPFLPILLSITAVDFIRMVLSGLNNPTKNLSVGAIKVATLTGCLLARIFGTISPKIKITEVTTIT